MKLRRSRRGAAADWLLFDFWVRSVKRFNNWVKSVLIQRFAKPAAVVLDLCCGKVSMKCIHAGVELQGEVSVAHSRLLFAALFPPGW
jgi:hypothetical protein